MQYEQISGRSLHDAMARAKLVLGNDIVLLETETLTPQDPGYDEDRTTRITVGVETERAAGRSAWPDAFQSQTQATGGSQKPAATPKNMAFQPFLEASLQNETAVPSPKNGGKSELEQLRGQVNDLHKLLARVVQPNIKGVYASAFELLINQGLDQKDALDFIGKVQVDFHDQADISEDKVRQALQREILPFLPRERVTDTLQMEGQRILSFAGAPGVGKTTTLMKIALHPAMAATESIGVLSLDTYGMGAGEALNSFSRLTQIAVETVSDKKSLQGLLQRWSRKQVVLVDTPGRGPGFPNYIENLNAMLELIQPTDRYLVFDMRSDLEDMCSSGDLFSALNPSGIIATKFDETTRPGKVISLSRTLNLPVVFACDGQEVTGRYKPVKLNLFAE